jgi:hypothetical protein
MDKNSPPPEGRCEKIEIKFDCGSPRPNGELNMRHIFFAGHRGC